MLSNEKRYAANLKLIRKTAGLTQSELAEKLKCRLSTVSYYETGGRNVSFKMAAKYLALAKKYKLNMQVADIRPAERLKHARPE